MPHVLKGAICTVRIVSSLLSEVDDIPNLLVFYKFLYIFIKNQLYLKLIIKFNFKLIVKTMWLTNEAFHEK